MELRENIKKTGKNTPCGWLDIPNMQWDSIKLQPASAVLPFAKKEIGEYYNSEKGNKLWSELQWFKVLLKKWWAVPQTMHEEMKLIITPYIITIIVTTTIITIPTFGLLPAGSICLSVAHKTLL